MIAFAALLALLVYLPIGYAATLEERRERRRVFTGYGLKGRRWGE